MRFPFIFQSASNDCGPTCLKMLAAYYDLHYDLHLLEKKYHLTKNGISMLDIFNAAKEIGFNCRGVKLMLDQLKEIVQQAPAILHCAENHFIVLYKAPKPQKKGTFYVADPARGLIKFQQDEFKAYWVGNEFDFRLEKKSLRKREAHLLVGYALLLEPFPGFYKHSNKELKKWNSDANEILKKIKQFSP